MLKNLIFRVIFFASKLYYFVIHNKKFQKHSIVLVPSWEGSLGDEAVIDSISTALKELGHHVTLIHFQKENGWSHLENIDDRFGIPNYFKSGGWPEHIRFIKLFSKNKYFYLLGTDMLDGSYGDWLASGLLKITHHAALTGLKTTIVSFSINSIQNTDCIKMIGHLPNSIRLCVRDNISKKRLEQLLPHKRLLLTADIAFLLKPIIKSYETIQILKWIEQQKANNRMILGVNINNHLIQNQTHDLIASIKTALSNIYKKTSNLSILLIPHDFRASNNEIAILKEFYAQLECQIDAKHLQIIKNIIQASEIKEIVKGVDLVINGRMHLSIACMSVGTPVGCFVYQGKFEGLFNHFSIPFDYLVNPALMLDSSNSELFIKKCINDRELIKQKIIDNTEKTLNKAFQNILN